MIDIFKDGVVTGLGAVLITRDKIEEKLKELVDEGKITHEEARRVGEELMQSGRGQWEEVKTRIAQAVGSGMEPLGLARKTELDALDKRVKELEERAKAADIRVKVLEGKIEQMQPGEDKSQEGGD